MNNVNIEIIDVLYIQVACNCCKIRIVVVYDFHLQTRV